MYEDFRREGLLEKVVVRGSDFYRSDYDTIYLTAKELNDIANEAASRWFIHKLLFYKKPRNFYNYLLPKAGSFNDFLYLIFVFFTLLHRKVRPIIISNIKKLLPARS